MDPVALASIAAGLALLLFGRKLFWLLVAAAGFLAGYWLTSTMLGGQAGTTALIVGLLGGAAGAVLAFAAHKVAVALGGFLAGGYGLMTLVGGLAGSVAVPEWVPFIIGGIIGAVLMRRIFEWALVILTSLIGAILIAHALIPGSPWSVPVTLLGAAVGIVIQFRSKRS